MSAALPEMIRGALSRKKWWWSAGVVGLILLTALSAWLAYCVFYRIPRGPSLPPQPAERVFSEHVIALNDQAGMMQISDPDEALRLYDEALEADSSYYLAHANKGQLLLQQGKYGEALASFERASTLRPRTAEYYMGSALCAAQLGDRRREKSDLLKALSAFNDRMESSPFHARLNRAVVLFLLGKDPIAYRELDHLERHSSDPISMSVIAGLREAMKGAKGHDRWTVVK